MINNPYKYVKKKISTEIISEENIWVNLGHTHEVSSPILCFVTAKK